MATTIFDSISHADFLRLTLDAFSRQGYVVEQSSAAGADAVLLGKNGARIGILCKKYRGAFIGRPVLQQFYGAMVQLGCTEGYLITTTDCSSEAHDFASGKGIVLYSSERTTELLRTAFGDEFIRSGKMPKLGMTAKTVPSAARQTISVASYEQVAVSDLKKAVEPVKAPEPVPAPEPVRAPEPEKAPEPEQAPLKETASEELPEEVQEVQSIESPGASEAVPPENTTIIVCLECNKQLRVPIDQGMITVICPECGMRRLYQPEMNSAGELKTTTIITCQRCSQKLNIPTNRGQLNVRCPQCKATWLFTP
jgi:DNA-directed RNA polymerase subunit RPC12/RpoP